MAVDPKHSNEAEIVNLDMYDDFKLENPLISWIVSKYFRAV